MQESLTDAKVTCVYEDDLGVNRKCICNFLLVINSNFGSIFYRLGDIDV